MEVRSRCPGFPVDWYDEYMMNIDYKQRAIEQSIIYLMSSKKNVLLKIEHDFASMFKLCASFS